MSWKSSVYYENGTHVWTEPNFNDYDEGEVKELYIQNQFVNDLDYETVCYRFDSVEGQALYKMFSGMQKEADKLKPKPKLTDKQQEMIDLLNKDIVGGVVKIVK